MKLLESTKKYIRQDKDREDVPKLESVEVVLVQSNLVNNNCPQVSKVLFTFVPKKQFGQLINPNCPWKGGGTLCPVYRFFDCYLLTDRVLKLILCDFSSNFILNI